MEQEILKSLSDSQQSAIAKLNKYKVGALFMEQGTGKTRTAIELVNSTNCDYVLYIAPYRVIHPETTDSIKDEINKWGGFNAITEYLGVESLSMSDRLFTEQIDKLKMYSKPFIIIDESIKIKNMDAKRTKRVLEIGKLSFYRLILNGTPITRDLLDLYSQMYFLSPKIIGMGLNEFKHTFCRITTVTKRKGSSTYKREFISGYENIDYLHSLISNYVYRCNLKLNLDQNYHDIDYNIQDKEEYKRLKNYFLSDGVLFKMNNNIFMKMTQSMQRSYSLDTGKVEAMDQLMANLDREKTIIFCKYIASRSFCKNRYKGCLVLSFQKSSLGLNLQQYNNTVYFDKVWDYYLMEQSKSRTYREGQTKDCNYYNLTGDVGLERIIDLNIGKKINMAEYLNSITLNELKKTL